jgi:hypothetical protein
MNKADRSTAASTESGEKAGKWRGFIRHRSFKGTIRVQRHGGERFGRRPILATSATQALETPQKLKTTGRALPVVLEV